MHTLSHFLHITQTLKRTHTHTHIHTKMGLKVRASVSLLQQQVSALLVEVEDAAHVARENARFQHALQEQVAEGALKEKAYTEDRASKRGVLALLQNEMCSVREYLVVLVEDIEACRCDVLVSTSVLQVCFSVLHAFCSVMQCDAVWCSVFQCFTVCYSMLQCIAL